jgi:hypothetical protein
MTPGFRRNSFRGKPLSLHRGSTCSAISHVAPTRAHGTSTDFFRRKSSELSAALEEEDPDCPALAILRGPTTEAGNGWQLADALRAMMGDQPVEDFHKFLNSCLMLDEPNGIGRGRRIRLRIETAARKTGNVTCIALSNTSLEFLVHRHLRNVGKGFKARELSLPHFIALLRERYGYYVDQAPPDVHVPGELVTRNRQILERRLRDLGLLVGGERRGDNEAPCPTFSG